MSTPDKSSELGQRAMDLLEGEYLEKAADPEEAAQIEAELDEKLEHLAARKGERFARVRELARQAQGLWAERGRLERKHMIYLGAALLYFISPIDAMPDVLPMLGYLDDIAVLSAVITTLVSALDRAKGHAQQLTESVVDDATDKLVAKGRVALNEVVDERADELFGRLEESAANAVDNSVTTLVLSLWGMTSAAALSLAMAAIFGGFHGTWAVYVLVTAIAVCLWNVAVAVHYLRGYRQLEGAWQRRLRVMIASRLNRRHLFALGAPLVALLGLGIARIFI